MSCLNSDYSKLHIAQDKTANFFTVVCLHRYQRGPALGGCRFVEYASTDEAIEEVIRLSRTMSYKAAISGLPHDGGKAIIIKPKDNYNRELLLTKFSQFVNTLNGEYITTIDSGTSPQDMSIIYKNSAYVTGLPDPNLPSPSNSTAFGVLRGIQAAAQLVYGSDNLTGLRIAIQGLGSVGYLLAQNLYQQGAQLIVSDINHDLAKRCQQYFNATVVSVDKIVSIDCDVFAPCALGRVITSDNIESVRAKIIAGAANDPLDKPELADHLEKSNILYIPDYVINAGGLIHLALLLQGKTYKYIQSELNLIFKRTLFLADQAKNENKTLLEIANFKAKNILENHNIG